MMTRREPLILLMLVACGDVREHVARYQNEGAVCLSSRATGGTHVQAVLDGCADACAKIKAFCSTQALQGVIDLNAEGSAITEESRGEPDDCPTLCRAIEARCELPALPDGVYELRYGDRSTTVELPVKNPRTEVLPGADSSMCMRVPVLP